MKKLIAILFYFSLSLVFLGLLLTVLDFSGIFIFFIGFSGITIYYSTRTIKNLLKHTNTVFNISLQVVLILMSVVLFAKYCYYEFANFPALLIIPVFIVLSIANLTLYKSKDLKNSITSILYLLAIIPLFAFEFRNSPVQFLQSEWFDRYNIEKNVDMNRSYPFGSKEAEELDAKAFRLSEYKNYSEALNIYKKAISIDSKNPRLYFDIANCYLRSNDLESGIKALDTAIYFDDNNPMFYNNRGLIFYKLSNNERAINDYKKAIELDSTESTYFINIALAYYYSDHRDKACESLKKAENLGVKLEDYEWFKNIECK